MDMKGKRVLLYARVSTDEQARHGESIADQLQELTRWAEKNGCIVVQTFVDEGFSARKAYSTRPALRALLEAVEARKADAVVFTKLDRWFRNIRDYGKVQEVLERCGVFWLATLEDYETLTSAGRFKVNLMLSIAEHEADQTSERIRFTFQQKRERGEIISGNMPKGYILRDGKPVKDPETKAGMEAFWAEYLRSGRMYAAMDAAALCGLRLSVSTGSFILRNAAHYAGQIQGCPCEPYITEADRDKVAATRKATPRRTGQTYLFSGLVYCGECKGRMGVHRSTYKRKHSQGVQVYYNCTRRYGTRPQKCFNNVNIYERDIESELLSRMDGALAAVAAQAETSDADRTQSAARASAAAEEIDRMERRKKRLLEAFLDGHIDRLTLRAQTDEMNRKIEALRRDTDGRQKKTPEEILRFLPAGWRAIYEDLDMEHKRNFWFQYVQRIEVNPDRTVDFTLAV